MIQTKNNIKSYRINLVRKNPYFEVYSMINRENIEILAIEKSIKYHKVMLNNTYFNLNEEEKKIIKKQVSKFIACSL